jgi:hypothetical protein
MEIRSAAKPGQAITATRMGSGCLGYGWMAFPEIPPELKKGDTLTISITHDTGDLWGKLSKTSKHVVE